MSWPHVVPFLGRLVCVASLLLVSCGLAGCGGGPRIVPAAGNVLINGKPLTGHSGFVRVVPAGFRAATGRIDPADGSFALTTFEAGDGCVTGTHPAAVIVNAMVGNRLVWIVPERYGDDATSGLTITVSGPTESLVIDLEGELTVPKPPTAEERRLEEAG